MSDLYILAADGRTPIALEDDAVLAWGDWHHEHRGDCLVGFENVGHGYVSTRFFGMEMNIARLFNERAPQHLFESMAFLDGQIAMQERCSTWAEAEAQHADMVASLQKAAAG